jgi:hypothetical protein
MYLLQSSAADAAAPAAFFGFFMILWCGMLSLGISGFVLFIIALVQILQRAMPTEAKILWGAVAWLVPVLGPILWWTIGSKQNPPMPSTPPPDHV